MTTNRIRPPSSLIDIAEALSQERMHRARHPLKPGPNADTASGLAPNHDIQMLRQRLGDLTKDVNLEDMHAVLKVRESVVREVLLWEFGEEFRTDSQFSPMAEAIEKAMDATPTFQQRLVDLIVDLRKS